MGRERRLGAPPGAEEGRGVTWVRRSSPSRRRVQPYTIAYLSEGEGLLVRYRPGLASDRQKYKPPGIRFRIGAPARQSMVFGDCKNTWGDGKRLPFIEPFKRELWWRRLRYWWAWQTRGRRR